MICYASKLEFVEQGFSVEFFFCYDSETSEQNMS